MNSMTPGRPGNKGAGRTYEYVAYRLDSGTRLF